MDRLNAKKIKQKPFMRNNDKNISDLAYFNMVRIRKEESGIQKSLASAILEIDLRGQRSPYGIIWSKK